jgi:ribosomal protein L29
MAVKDLEKKSVKDLEKELQNKRNSLKDFRFGLSGSKTRNTKEGVSLRKGIARILTELNTR